MHDRCCFGLVEEEKSIKEKDMREHVLKSTILVKKSYIILRSCSKISWEIEYHYEIKKRFNCLSHRLHTSLFRSKISKIKKSKNYQCNCALS